MPDAPRVALFAAVLFAAPAFAGVPAGAFDDVTEEWCLDAEAKEIYTTRLDGAREVLVVSEAVVVDGEAIDSTDMERMFDEGLVEAVDGADALSTSFVADAWETVIETFYGHDAFGQRVEIVGEQTNDAGHRCRLLKAPGFATMFRAFRGNNAEISQHAAANIVKTYAPETVEFDGRTFYLLSERNGATGEILVRHDNSPGGWYNAVYLDAPRENAGAHTGMLYHQVFYSEDPKEYRRGGLYSANAMLEQEYAESEKWTGDPPADYSEWALLNELREAENGDLVKLHVIHSSGRPHASGFASKKGMKIGARRCGESRADAFMCAGYRVNISRDIATYDAAKTWLQNEGKAEVDRIVNLLTSYSLTHNEELLADLQTAVRKN